MDKILGKIIEFLFQLFIVIVLIIGCIIILVGGIKAIYGMF